MKGLDVLAYETSPIGMIGLRRRELPTEPGTVVTEITLDHTLLMSSGNVTSEQALAERALALHAGDGLTVLVGGLGLGHTALAVLRSRRVARLEVVEFLPQVIGWLEAGLLPLSQALKSDARLALREGDVYAELTRPPLHRFDLVLVDVDHSPDEPLAAANEFFYAEEGLVRAKRHLAPSGVLGVWSYEECPRFERTLRRVFREVRVEPVAFRNRLVDEAETNWLYFGRD